MTHTVHGELASFKFSGKLCYYKVSISEKGDHFGKKKQNINGISEISGGLILDCHYTRAPREFLVQE